MLTETRVTTKKETFRFGQQTVGHNQLQQLKVYFVQLDGNSVELVGSTLLAIEFLHPTVQSIVLAPVGDLSDLAFWTFDFSVCV